jgi:hypothetical protein
MSLSVTLSDAIAASLAAEAARRDLTPDELAAELIAERLPAGRPANAGHRLRFGAIGASTSGRRATEDEQMLAEGFGR